MRRVNAAGGFATVLAKGDATAGAILFVDLNRGDYPRLFERGIGPNGMTELLKVGPGGDAHAVTDYWIRRRRTDPDLWVVEVDVADAERFVAETIIGG